MHVAFVTPEFLKNGRLYPGGLANYTYVTAKALAAKGIQVSVWVPSYRDSVTFLDGIRVIEVHSPNPFLLKLFVVLFYKLAPSSVIRVATSWRINRKLSIHRKSECIDIIHYTNWKAIGLFGIRKGGIIRISSYERLWDNNPSHKNLDKILCRWLESLTYRRFNTVIGPGNHLATLIRNELKLQREVIIVPTPLGPFTKNGESNFKSEGCKLVMYAGTISRIKGSSLLFSIIESYLEESSDAVFLVVGKAGMCDGKPVMPDIERLSKKFPSHFLYLSNLDKEGLMAAFSQADIVLIPSVIDNFPNTALEAASQGTLIIASDTASLGSLLKDGENAIILSDRTTKIWVEAIKSGLNLSEDVLEKMATNMKKAIKEHETEYAVDKLVDVYKAISSEVEERVII